MPHITDTIFIWPLFLILPHLIHEIHVNVMDSVLDLYHSILFREMALRLLDTHMYLSI